MNPTTSYHERKAFFDRVLTVYGRKPVMETLRNKALSCHQLHLAESNRKSSALDELLHLAKQREIPLRYHTREALAHISRNGRQDQGVALDVLCPGFQPLADYLARLEPAAAPVRLLALDGITNPQNLGMIIRSAAAGAIDGIICARRGNAALGPLVIKASAGTVYRAPLLQCEELPTALRSALAAGVEICALTAESSVSLFVHRPQGHCVYVLGNETEGVSPKVMALASTTLAIPMRNGVESLNVAVAASLIAYASELAR